MDQQMIDQRRFSALGGVVLAAGLALAAPLAAAQPRSVDLPLERLTLYRSGVGYFEHSATVRGSVVAELAFDASRINDILKSLVLLDRDRGTPAIVRYDSAEPTGRRLAGFAIDVTRLGSTADLLVQLRGVPVALVTLSGTLEGEVLAVEQRMTPFATEGAAMHFEEPYVTLVTDRGVQTIAISEIDELRIEDERLSGELDKALAVLAEARSDATRTVELGFNGPEIPRRVTAAYTHETPVWKTSYRLVLDDSAESGGGGAMLQGWAIVENTTDDDWEDITLSLAAGQPVGFTMNLYEPIFAPRPEVPVPIQLAGAGRLYENELERDRSARGGGDSPFAAPARTRAARGDFAESAGLSAQDLAKARASGAEIGQQFLYTVDAPVTVDRQSSAMLPIIAASVGAERVSIWSEGDPSPHPMKGLNFTNTAGTPILPGPVAVFDGGTYAGDAQLGQVAPGDDRLLAYAADLDVSIDREQQLERDITSIRIVSGVLVRETRSELRTSYDWVNNDQRRGRTLVIEHEPRSGWEVEAPSEARETAAALRYTIELPPGSSGSFPVTESSVTRSTLALVRADIDDLVVLRRERKVTRDVIEAVREARDLQEAIAETEAELEAIADRIAEIEREQERIRANMDAVARDTPIYQRYLSTLTDQEDELADLRERRPELRERLAQRQKALRDFLRNLTVD